jgi:hypothetical protein
MRSKYSLQHQALVTHAEKGRLVYYASPRFHNTEDLNDFYNARKVPPNSVFIRPDRIGSVTDEAHHVAYGDKGNVAWLYSDPIRIEGNIDFENFLLEMNDAISPVRRREVDRQFFLDVAEDITQSLKKTVLWAEQEARDQPQQAREALSPSWQVGYEEPPQVRAERVEHQARQRFHSLLERYPLPIAVGYMVRFYLDCELIIVGSGESKINYADL